MAYDESKLINLGHLKDALELVRDNMPEDTDTKVTQTLVSDSVERPLLTAPTAQSSTTTTTAAFSTSIKANASTGNLTATKFTGDGTDINVGSTSGNAVYTTTSGKLTSGSLATSDPTASGTATDFIATVSQDAKGQITATKSSLPAASSSVSGITKVGASSEGAAAYNHVHGNITNDGKVGSTSGYAVYTTTGGAVTSGSLAVTDPTASGNATSFIDTISQDDKGQITATKKTIPTASDSTAGIAKLGATGGSATYEHVHGNITNDGKLATASKIVVTDSSKNITTGSIDPSDIVLDNDSRLTDARTPVAHASSSTTYGAGSDTNYGHVKLSDSTSSSDGVSSGTAATPAAVKAVMDVATGAMTFKGTVGTGGTVTSLPTEPTKGDTYKAISAITYDGTTYKVGDTFICLTPKVGSTAATWEVIPSGDEPSGTVTNIATGSGLTGGPITSTGTISHDDTSSQASMTTGGRTYVNSITLDDFGHVTALGTNTETDQTVGNKALKLASDSGTATQAITMNESSADRTATIKGDGTYITGAVSGSANAPVVTLSHAASGTAGSTSPSSAQTPSYGDTFNIPVISYDAAGHITSTSTTTVQIPASDNTDTLNTAGSNNDTAKMYLVGAKSQTTGTSGVQTYSNSAVYATNGVVTATGFEGSGADINVGSTADYAVYTTTSGKLTSGSLATTDPTASGNAAAFIDTISQDSKGKITATKKNITPPTIGSGYGTCATAASTAAKEVTLADYNLTTGGIVSVKFTYSVPASATLNINSKGAKAIYYNGSAITAGIIQAGDLVTFIYDGTNYHVIGILLENKILFSQSSLTLATTRWSSSGDTTYPYKAVITMPGVTEYYYPTIQFRDSDTLLYDFSPVATTGDGTITIMCKTAPTTAVIISQIVCYRGQSVTAS